MGGHEARHHWEHVGLMMLIGSVLLPPFAWLVDMQVSYALVKWACAHGRRDVLLVMPLGSLALVATAGWMAWSCWRALQREASPDGARMEDRSYFLALTGLAMTAVFGLLILTSLAPRYLLSPCE